MLVEKKPNDLSCACYDFSANLISGMDKYNKF